MTATLLAANAAWIGLVVALWTKRLPGDSLRTTFDCSAQPNKPFAISAIPKALIPHILARKRRPPKGGKRKRVQNHMIVTGKIAAILAATAVTVAAVLAFASVA